MALALPSEEFVNVQRYLRQRRAGGQTVTPREARLAWQSYWDVNAARALERSRIDLAREQFNKDYKLRKDIAKKEEEAATVAGIAELGTTAALGAYALKGTNIGSKIGLGTTKSVAPSVPSTAAPGVALTAGPKVAADISAAADASIAALGPGELGGFAETFGATVPTVPTIPPLASLAPPALAGGAAGFLGAALGEKVIGEKVGGTIGGAAAGAGAGFLVGSQMGSVGGPPGAIIGGVIGGTVGLVKSVKD